MGGWDIFHNGPGDAHEYNERLEKLTMPYFLCSKLKCRSHPCIKSRNIIHPIKKM
jgi:hypothetical protein